LDYKEKAEIDLHIHSNASDGTLSPEEIICKALEIGLKALSITDHDTVEGAREALKIGIPNHIRFMPGVEISTAFPTNSGYHGSCHILGYGIRLNDFRLNDILSILQNARKNRNPEIINRLNALDIPITLDDIPGGSIEKRIGRPHIAQAMVERGFAGSISDAFDKYLGFGKPAYVEKYKIECTKAIDIIKHAGGLPVLAHPSLLKPKRGAPFDNFLLFLKSNGLAGIEVFYSDHTPEDEEYFGHMAEKHNLLKTGGTDFHGEIRPDIQMGSGLGNLHIPYSVFRDLNAALGKPL
jgi:3',5'-nucleoside bisphosphate phosphatase